MNIIAVDDERLALMSLLGAIEKALPDSELRGFLSPAEALAHARSSAVDVAFLDVEMSEMSGLMLAQRLKETNPRTNIVFATAYINYGYEAISLHASGYLLKPVTPEAVTRELTQLRYPPPKGRHRVWVQCFGDFEVFVDGEPLKFSRQKTKELFAYLISKKGADCTIGEAVAILWEDRPNTKALQSNLRNLTADLFASLGQVGAGHVLCKKRGTLSVRLDALDCDYFDFCRGLPYAVNGFQGEFMRQYSWAEFTAASLEHRFE